MGISGDSELAETNTAGAFMPEVDAQIFFLLFCRGCLRFLRADDPHARKCPDRKISRKRRCKSGKPRGDEGSRSDHEKGGKEKASQAQSV